MFQGNLGTIYTAIYEKYFTRRLHNSRYSAPCDTKWSPDLHMFNLFAFECRWRLRLLLPIIDASHVEFTWFNYPISPFRRFTLMWYCYSWWAHAQCAVKIRCVTSITVQHGHIRRSIVPRPLLYQQTHPRRFQPYRKQPQKPLTQTQSCRYSSRKSADTPCPTILPPTTTAASPINMSSIKAPLTSYEFSKCIITTEPSNSWSQKMAAPIWTCSRICDSCNSLITCAL